MKIGEFEFLRRLLPRLPQDRSVVVGPGHDCARVRAGERDWLFTTDALVEGTHFRSAWLTPYELGWRAFAVNASDLAAMGGLPRFLVVNLGVPRNYRATDLALLEKGLAQAAKKTGASVIGGNLTRARELSVSVALVGEAPARVITRCGASPGERIFVTGTVGDAALAVHWLRKENSAPPALRQRWVRPTPRLELGRRLVERRIATAAIDISDGLLQDLAHLCRQSQVGALVDVARLPLSREYQRWSEGDLRYALEGGEDYELLFTAPSAFAEEVVRIGLELRCPVQQVGEVVQGRGVWLLTEGGKRVKASTRGFDHFRI